MRSCPSLTLGEMQLPLRPRSRLSLHLGHPPPQGDEWSSGVRGYFGGTNSLGARARQVAGNPHLQVVHGGGWWGTFRLGQSQFAFRYGKTGRLATIGKSCPSLSSWEMGRSLAAFVSGGKPTGDLINSGLSIHEPVCRAGGFTCCRPRPASLICAEASCRGGEMELKPRSGSSPTPTLCSKLRRNTVAAGTIPFTGSFRDVVSDMYMYPEYKHKTAFLSR